MDAITARLTSLASTWKDEVQRRRKMSAHDPMADAIAYCADEILSEIALVTA